MTREGWLSHINTLSHVTKHVRFLWCTSQYDTVGVLLAFCSSCPSQGLRDSARNVGNLPAAAPHPIGPNSLPFLCPLHHPLFGFPIRFLLHTFPAFAPPMLPTSPSVSSRTHAYTPPTHAQDVFPTPQPPFPSFSTPSSRQYCHSTCVHEIMNLKASISLAGIYLFNSGSL